MLIIGHRGASGYFEENTVESIRQAAQIGADGVEFDVRRCNSRIVGIHDETVDRTTTGAGKLGSLSLQQFKNIKTFNGERLPYMEDLLKAARYSKIINIEMKEPDIGSIVVNTLERFRAAHQCDLTRFLLSSFERVAIEAIRDLDLGYRLGVLYKDHFNDGLEWARELGAFSIHIPFKDAQQENVKRAQSYGLKVYCYTVNSRANAEYCKKIGVDGIFSDLLKEVLTCKQLNPA